jgi:hypothetical protein
MVAGIGGPPREFAKAKEGFRKIAGIAWRQTDPRDFSPMGRSVLVARSRAASMREPSVDHGLANLGSGVGIDRGGVRANFSNAQTAK